ncbi:MAG TPA: cytochrome c oxidase assembly protein [Rudaea sp.]
MKVFSFAISALTGAIATMDAHAHEAVVAGGLPGWSFEGWVVAPMLLSLAWFGIGIVRLSQLTNHPRALRRQAAWFLSGWLVLALALVSPLHEAGERSFAAHMAEHELLMLVAAPLLVFARPIGIALWAFPRGGRRALGAFGRSIRVPWRFLTTPVIATLLQAAALWLWHAPRWFDLALAHPGWHIAQHVSFLATALLFWWSVLRGAESSRGAEASRGTGITVGCLFFTSMVSGALGALMAFSGSAWYAGYAGTGLDAFGLTPTEDQQLAGLLMWIPGGLVHAGAGLALFTRALRERAGGSVDAVR